MKNLGTYYISRIEKAPQADWGEIDAAITNPVIIDKGKYKYAIVDHSVIIKEKVMFGKMVKYQEIGINELVNETKMTVERTEIPRRIVASSPFIYSAANAYIAYLHVWNNIRDDDFRTIFDQLIRQGAPVSGFRLNPITNEEMFVSRIKQFDKIYEMKTRVVPPNPLFGPLWEEIKEYLKRRKLREIRQKEACERQNSLASRLLEIIDNRNIDPNQVDFGDKLMLMAMDGYGEGTIKGQVGKATRKVKTSDARESFEFDKEPQPSELAQKAESEYSRIKTNRDWVHP
jgi:hypothetical protein